MQANHIIVLFKQPQVFACRYEGPLAAQESIYQKEGIHSNQALFSHKCHIWELSIDVLHDPVPQGVSKIQEVKVENICIYLR